MDNDPQTTSGPQEQPDQERQNRRQFFNGLGKWSLAIIAAVSSLARSGTRAQASLEDTPKAEPGSQRPAWTVSDDGNPRQRMAGYFRQRPHGNHNRLHNDYIKSTSHRNYNPGGIQ